MSNLITHVFWRILRILTSLLMSLRWTAHLTKRRSRLPMSLSYFWEMSSHTLNLWVRWPSVWVSIPSVHNMRLLTSRRMILPTSPPEFQRPKHLLMQGTNALTVKHDQETHTINLSLGECSISINNLFFYLKSNLFLLLVVWNWVATNV
jgi:hypothetical protein